MTDTDAKKVIGNLDKFFGDCYWEILSRIRLMIDIFGAAGLIGKRADDTRLLNEDDFQEQFT